MNQNPKKTIAEGMQIGSTPFWMTLIAMALFVCILIPILLSCAFDPSPKLTAYTGTPISNEPTITDPAFIPVFAPSSVVVKPYVTGQTVSFDQSTTLVDSQYAVLMDAETGEIIAAKQSRVQFSPASMTKVMTLIVACEHLSQEDLERKIPFSEEIHEYVTSGDYKGMELGLPVKTKSGLSCIGDRYIVKDMLYGIGVKSAAACTYMVVREICDSEADFVALMNAKAQEMGLTNTVFDNVVGFDSKGNQTTAEDMATIMAYAMQSELIADILKPRTNNYTISAHWEKEGQLTTYNVSLKPSFKSRLDKYSSFALTGVSLEACKTGYTNESFIVVSAISKTTGARYILVLGDKENGTHESITTKFENTMIDIETMFNTFVP